MEENFIASVADLCRLRLHLAGVIVHLPGGKNKTVCADHRAH